MNLLGVFRCTNMISELLMLEKIEEIESVWVSAIIDSVIHVCFMKFYPLTLQNVRILASSNTEDIQDIV